MTADAPLVADVVVVGLGSGGERAARQLAEAGLQVVAVERDLVGGECPFWGCTPSKLLVRSADLVAEARRADRLAGPTEVRPDWNRPLGRIREATHDWHDAQHADPLTDAGVRLLRGHGRLDGPRRVVVDSGGSSTVVEVRRGVLLDTGTEPAVPEIDGLADTPYWTNRDLVRQPAPPDSLVVVGGGPIGAELAQALARYGTRVTLLEARDRLLHPEEAEAAAVVEECLRGDGIDVRTGVDVAAVRHDGRFHVDLGTEVVAAERLLVATGRRPNLAGIGLETVGLDAAAGHLPVDDRMRAGDGLWAIGDITGKGAFTHVAVYQGEIAVSDILGADGPRADYRAVSRVTFTDPEVGAVGLTEEQAREAGVRVAVGRADIGTDSRGWMHDARGLVKVVADADRGVLVGGTVVAPYGGEVVGLLSTAVHARVPVETLGRMHFAFPTFHRTIARALADLGLDG